MKINGRSLSTSPGTTVLEVALAHGIHVPRLCYHPELSVSGGCRLCMVEVEGFANPVASCGLLCDEVVGAEAIELVGRGFTSHVATPFHWREASANMLTQDFKLDPVAKIPEYKVCAVRLVNPRKKK